MPVLTGTVAANGTVAAAASFLDTHKVPGDFGKVPVRALRGMGFLSLLEAKRVDESPGGGPGLSDNTDIQAILHHINTLTATVHSMKGRVAALEKEKEEVRQSVEFSHQEVCDLKTALANSIRRVTQLSHELIRLQSTTDPDMEERRRTLVVTGLASGGARGEPMAQVKTLLGTPLQLEPELEVESVLQVSRGKQGGDGDQPRPDRVLILFKTRSAAQLVRGAAPRLRQENVRRKTAGEIPIGIDWELSPEERRCRGALFTQFKQARGEGKRCQWEGGKLFVEGREVLPPV
jgi:hypothetical protein